MKPASDTCTVVVVGGGPAGAAAATWLARAGFDVTLLDRARFPRDKACGEFLTPQTRTLLTEMGAWEPLCAAGLRPLAHTLLCASDGGQMRYQALDGSPVGYALRRVTLDAILLDLARQAGVQVREGCAVLALLRDGQGRVGGVCGRDEGGEPFTLRARLVIGADGTHSLVARQLGLVRPLPRLQRLAVVSHWRSVPGDCDAIEMRANGGIVCGLSFPGGKGVQVFRCSGVLEKQTSTLADEVQPRAESGASEPEYLKTRIPEDPDCCANLTLVAPTSQAAKIAGRAGDWVEQMLQELFPEVAARLAGATREPQMRTVGCFGHVCRPAVADGALLVGDAAAFVDPFTGEGVYFGLRGAQLAAEAAGRALHSGDISRQGLLPYQRARRELAQRYLICDIVQKIIRTPALSNRVVHRLSRCPDAAERLFEVIGDLRPPTAALHPALLWSLLGL